MPRSPYTAGMDAARILPLAFLAATALAGCDASVAPSFDDPTPQARIGALGRAASSGDLSSVPRCVENLSSDDAAVRMAAAGALRRLTGETLGYRFDAPAKERAEAIDRWRAWVANHPAPGTDPR